MPDTDCTTNFGSYYNPLSLIGDFYSYEFGESSESACGKPGSTVGVKSISLKTGKQISILELFEEKDVVAAFKNDPWVLKMAKQHQTEIDTIKTLEDVTSFLSSTYDGIKFAKSSFCVLDFKNRNAKIRFVAREYMGYNHHKHLQLGLEIPVKKEALVFFKDMDNFFLGAFDNWLQK